jgi:hypothetical protein
MGKEIKYQKQIYFSLLTGQFIPLIFCGDKYSNVANYLLVLLSFITLILPLLGWIYYRNQIEKIQKIENYNIKFICFRRLYLIRLLSIQIPMLLGLIFFSMTGYYLFWIFIICLLIPYILYYPSIKKQEKYLKKNNEDNKLINNELESDKGSNNLRLIIGVACGIISLLIVILSNITDTALITAKIDSGVIKGSVYINKSLRMKMKLPEGYSAMSNEDSKYFPESIKLLSIRYDSVEFRCFLDLRSTNKSLSNDSIYVVAFENDLFKIRNIGVSVDRINEYDTEISGEIFHCKLYRMKNEQKEIEIAFIYKLFREYTMTILINNPNSEIGRLLIKDINNSGFKIE